MSVSFATSKDLSKAANLATLAFALSLSQSSLDAAQRIYEGFNYRPGTMDALVEGGGYGLVGSWFTQFGDSASFADYRIASGTLPGVEVTDARFMERTTSSRLSSIFRQLAVPIVPANGIRYVSAVIRAGSDGGLLPRGAEFQVQLSGANWLIKMGAYASTGELRPGLSGFGPGSSRVVSSGRASPGQALRFILKIEPKATTLHCSLFVDKSSEQTADAVMDVFSDTFTTVGLISNYPFAVDELRVADTWEELALVAPAARPSVILPEYQSAEGNSGAHDIQVPIRLSAPSPFATRVGISAVAGSATASADFVPRVGTIEFAPGETEKNFQLQIIGDTQQEPDETVVIVATSASGANLPAGQGVVIIGNDDVAVVEPNLSIQLELNEPMLRWSVTPQQWPLQFSRDLVTWENVVPLVTSAESGQLNVSNHETKGYYRFLRAE